MPKHKKKQASLKNTNKGKDKWIESNQSSTQTNPPGDRVEVEEVPFEGRTILDVGDEQPMMSRESGEAWDYHADPQVREVLEETEQLDSGGEELAESLRQHSAESPILSGGDVDAAWDYANDSGEAAGLVYQDEEPLDSEAKIEKRDRHRWELNPASKE